MTAPIQMPAASTADTDQGEEAGQGAGLATSRPAPDTLIALAREGRIAVVPVEADEALVYRVANAKLGEGPSVRCEGPTSFEKDVAREWVKRVLAASPLASPTLTPALLALAEERDRLREALGEAAAAIRKG